MRRVSCTNFPVPGSKIFHMIRWVYPKSWNCCNWNYFHYLNRPSTADRAQNLAIDKLDNKRMAQNSDWRHKTAIDRCCSIAKLPRRESVDTLEVSHTALILDTRDENLNFVVHSPCHDSHDLQHWCFLTRRLRVLVWRKRRQNKKWNVVIRFRIVMIHVDFHPGTDNNRYDNKYF